MVPVSASTPLIESVRTGDRAAVRAALGQSPDLRAADPDGTTALHWAALADDLETVSLLLEAGASAGAANRYGVTALSLAAENGNAPMIRVLLRAGADPNTTLPEGETALMTAARGGHAAAIDVLLAAGADVEARERFHGESALIWAAARNHAAAVRALLAGGAGIDARSQREQYAGRTQGLTQLPLGEWTPLMYAARQGALDAGRALTDAGAGIDLQDPDGATALVLAIINAQFHVAAYLIERGADPNIADSSGMAALYAAVDMHTLPWTFGLPDPVGPPAPTSRDIIEQLIAHGADVNARLTRAALQRLHTTGDEALVAGATIFMRAAKSGDAATMRLLLAHGADPRVTLKDGANALMLAAGLGYRDGNAAVPTRDRGTDAEAIDAIAVCLEQGIDVNAATTRGDTALHQAVAGRGSDAIVRFLVEKGARLDAMNTQDRTPLDVALASRKDRTSNAELLRKLMAAAAKTP